MGVKYISPKAIAVIPARGGSRRIPRKNVKRFHGKEIIAYSIEAAYESGLFEAVLVSTDDQDIAATAVLHQAGVILRPKDLAIDSVGTQEVTLHALHWVKARQTHKVDAVCCIYATAPLIRITDLHEGRRALMQEGCSHAFAVGFNPLRDAGQFYWSHAWALQERVPYVWPSAAMIPIPSEHVCDINTPEDWTMAELMYAKLHKGIQ